MDRVTWTQEEIAILKEMYCSSKIQDIENSIKTHNRNSIYSKARKLKLAKDIQSPRRIKKITNEQRNRLVRSHTPWTVEQENTLRELYPTTKSSELESVFPEFTAIQIALRARQIGVKKDYNFFVSTGLEGADAKWSKENPFSGEYPRGKGWKRSRRMARHRAGYKCEWCGANEESLGYKLSVHHIIRFDDFGYIPGENENYKIANRQSNLVAICRSCHTSFENSGMTNRQEALEFFANNPRSDRDE